jgi:hypothetical protein
VDLKPGASAADKSTACLRVSSRGSVEIVAAIAGIASVLVCWVVSLRLLSLAKRTRQAPELLIGLGLLLAGGLWSPLMAVGRQATALPDPVRATVVVAGAITAICGMSCIAIFNWRVFRPADSWAPAFVSAVAVALIGLALAQSFGSGWMVFAHHEQGPWTSVSWVGVVIYTWSSIEAGRQYSMMTRRQRLGLADPVVTDRMRIWTLMMLTSVLASLVFATCQMLGIAVAGTTVGLSLTAVAAFLSAVFLYLAFMPPSSYLESVRRRAQPMEA